MRNSPFQLKNQSVVKTMETNLAYKRHRQNIASMQNKSPRDYLGQMKGKNNSLQRTRKFENDNKHKEEEKSNLRLLSRFVEIQRGNHLSVPRAAYMTHITHSPVQKQHSLAADKKKIEDMVLLKSNLDLMRRLQKTESHTKFDDLQSEWTEKKRLRDLVAVVSKSRLNGLVQLKASTTSPSQILAKQINFESRNQSMSPSLQTDPMRKELNASSQLRTKEVMKTQTMGFSAASGLDKLHSATDIKVEENLRAEEGSQQSLVVKDTKALPGGGSTVQQQHASSQENVATVQKQASMAEIVDKQEDLLQDRLNEVGSVQHQDDRQHMPSNMNLPVINDGAGSDLNTKRPGNSQDHLPFYSPQNSNAQLLHRGSNETLTSTIFELGSKTRREIERHMRKYDFDKKVDKVYANPTIFKVHKKRPTKSTSVSQADQGQLRSLNLPEPTMRLPQFPQTSGTLSPTFLQSFATSPSGSYNRQAIQDNLSLLKKQALQQQKQKEIEELALKHEKVQKQISKLSDQLSLDLSHGKKPAQILEIKETGSPTLRQKQKRREERALIEQLLHIQKRSPNELNLTEKAMRSANDAGFNLRIGPTDSMLRDQKEQQALNPKVERASNDGSLQLLTEFRQSQGASVVFPPISPQEAREKQRTSSLIRDHSKRQMIPIPSHEMRALQHSPSQLINQSVLSGQASMTARGGGVLRATNTKHNTGLKDPSSLVLNIDRKFEKLTAVTSDGNKLGFFVHTSDKVTDKLSKIRLPRKTQNRASMPPALTQRSRTYADAQEHTMSMQRYQRELEFKNRILKEKEKKVFNQEMMKKLSKQQISTTDLKSERTLTNHRTSKKYLATVNSSGSFANQESLNMHDNQDLIDQMGPGDGQSRSQYLLEKDDEDGNGPSEHHVSMSQLIQKQTTDSGRDAKAKTNYSQSQLLSLGVTPKLQDESRVTEKEQSMNNDAVQGVEASNDKKNSTASHGMNKSTIEFKNQLPLATQNQSQQEEDEQEGEEEAEDQQQEYYELPNDGEDEEDQEQQTEKEMARSAEQNDNEEQDQ